MRLHRLSVTAFGPFVDTAEVDFDALSAAGLFLLSGATGAGKSSVLDAVCFALYGAVPGDRQDAGRLRSDQAPLRLAPHVSLEVSLSGRRFRVDRSPAWDRPKKRGSGTTREQARVTLSERVADDWVHLTSRLDEAGDLISGLLGMNLDQFCQVAMLPQGHFQAFLRAKPDERQRLLARLFRTGRFERVEAWLRDHRLALRRRSETQASIVGDLVSRLSEVAHTPVPADCADLASAPDDGLPTWVETVRADATSRRTTTAAEADDAAAVHDTASAALAAARELATSRARVVAAAETIERLDLEREHHNARAARLERARRAEGVHPLARLVDQREQACAEAQQRAEASRAQALRAEIDVDDLPAALDRLADDLAAVTNLLPAEQLLDDLRRQQAAVHAELEQLAGEDELARAESTTLTALQVELGEVAQAADVAAAALPDTEAELERLDAIATAHDDVARLTVEHDSASAEHAAARAAVVDLREVLLDLRERRIAGMAAELAGGLVVGGDCPVCGSHDHPHPAVRSAAHPDAEAEREAQRAVDDAQAVELAQQLRLRDVATSLAAARKTAEPASAELVTTQIAEARRTVDRLRGHEAAGITVRPRIAEASGRASALATAASARRVRNAELDTTREHVRARVSELEEQVGSARGEHPALRAAVASLTARRELMRSVEGDAAALEAASESLDDATTALGRAVQEAGFDTPDEARAAVLSPTESAELERSLHDHRTALAAARQVLDEPDSLDLLTTPDPDVPAAEAVAREAAEMVERSRAARQVAARAHERVRLLADELDSALAAWSPVREELALASSVSAFAEGKAPDNAWQMRLSAYVLAFRLSQVVAAANARLAGMSDQRYSLEHVGRRGAGETRGGLSLVVRDDWSGESRDPATLSGGETFVVSLALALGLADVVAHEAGGADLQTLFVDEGFGSLDAETLDDVLDILDSLRENGRAVGVVSHVAEMRDRIPTQLVVTKARTGSTLGVVGRGG